MKYDELEGLPPQEEMESLFHISGIEEDKLDLRTLAKHVQGRIDEYRDVVEHLIQPDNTLTAMNEAGAISDKQGLFEQLKRLNHATRRLDHALLTDKQLAEEISASHAYWKTERPKVAVLLEQMRDSWTKKNESKIEDYFG